MRKHIRLRDFDYSSVNAYFITICVQRFDCVFGEVRNGIMGLSDVGNMADVYMQNIVEKRRGVIMDEFIIMPNHVHCLIDFKAKANLFDSCNRFAGPIPNSVSIIINQYKGDLKKWCNANGYRHFEWQAKFYDHVIRNNEEYWIIKNYIINNPRKWSEDRLRP